MYQFNVKDSEIKYYTLCLGNFPKIFQLKVLFLAYNLKTARITRSAIIVEFNTKDVKFVKSYILPFTKFSFYLHKTG